MADQRGRCCNTEYCADAVSQRVVSVPEGEKFACPKCGEPLQSTSEARAKKRGKMALVLQVGVVILGGAALTYKLTNRSFIPGLQARTAPPAGEAQAAPAMAAVPAAAAAANPQPAPAPTAGTADASPAAATALLRFAGSDIIGARLAPRLAASYLGLIGSTGISVSPARADGTVEVTGQTAGQRDAITITSNSAAAGFTMLLRGNADVVMSAARISPADAERLTSLGDMTSSANESVIATQGIAVATSPANRLAALTVPQLRGIFSGRITDWSELGAAAGPIHVLIAQGRGAAAVDPQEAGLGQEGITATASRVAGDQMAAALMADRGSIGLLPYGSTGTAKVLAVGEGGAVAVSPTELTISTESYPLVRRLYLYTAPGTGSNLARRFTEYVFSPAGQTVVEAAGFVPLTVRTEAASIPDATPDRLRQALAGATRVSVDFRFQPGAKELDSRGARDLERLVAYVKTQRIAPGRLILAGFADNSGTPQVNQSVAQQRAETVASALSRNGVAPGKVVAFGSDLPLADNTTADGRERNRRVEVYLAP